MREEEEGFVPCHFGEAGYVVEGCAGGFEGLFPVESVKVFHIFFEGGRAVELVWKVEGWEMDGCVDLELFFEGLVDEVEVGDEYGIECFINVSFDKVFDKVD